MSRLLQMHHVGATHKHDNVVIDQRKFFSRMASGLYRHDQRQNQDESLRSEISQHSLSPLFLSHLESDTTFYRKIRPSARIIL